MPQYCDETGNPRPGPSYICSTISLFILFLVAYKGAGAFAKVNVWLFVGLMISLAVGIGSIFFGFGLDHGNDYTKVLKTVTYPKGSGDNHTGHFYEFAWEATIPGCNATKVNDTSCQYGMKTKLWPHPVQSDQCGDQVCDVKGVFAIIFPAVCGMMEGANLSGDLEDPAYAIPYGTVAAVSTAFCFYICLIVGQAATMDDAALQYNYFVMQDACINQYFVVLGVATACLSTSLGSMFGSSRIFQAISRDRLVPAPLWVNEYFSVGTVKGDEPRRAVVLTYIVSGTAVFIGAIQDVAPILTNFFLLTYCLTNLATFLLDISGLINFRPSWRWYCWHTALLGTLLNLIVMFYIGPLYATITCLIIVAVYIGIAVHGPMDGKPVDWGDISQALMFQQARNFALSLQYQGNVAKFWRPSLMLLAEDLAPTLLGFCDDMKKGGILVLGKAVTGDRYHAALAAGDRTGANELIERTLAAKAELLSQISTANLKAFPHVLAMPNARLACQNLVLSAGMQGALEPDIVVIPHWERNGDNGGGFMQVSGALEYVSILSDIISLGKNLMVAYNFGPATGAQDFRRSAGASLLTAGGPTNTWEKAFTSTIRQEDGSFTPRSIDLWLLPASFLKYTQDEESELEAQSSPVFALLVQLGYILALSRERKYKISQGRLRVLQLLDSSLSAAERIHESSRKVAKLQATLAAARITAEVKVVFTKLPDAPAAGSIQSTTASGTRIGSHINQVIRAHSETSVVSMMHLVQPPTATEEETCGQYIDELSALTQQLPLCMLVSTGQRKSVITTAI